MLICAQCADGWSKWLQKAKHEIADLTTQDTESKETSLLDLFPKHKWHPGQEIWMKVFMKGPDDPICAAGVGTNKQRYERATEFALSIALELHQGGRNVICKPLLESISQLFQHVVGQPIGTSKTMLLIPRVTPKPMVVKKQTGVKRKKKGTSTASVVDHACALSSGC